MADEVLDLIRGAPSDQQTYQSKGMATSAGRKKPASEEDEVLNLIQGTTTPQTQTNQPEVDTQQKTPMVRQIIGNVLKKGFEAKQAMPAFSAAALDIPASLPQFIANTVAYPFARGGGETPEQSKAFAEKVSAPLEYLKPGKFTGLENTAEYKQSLPTKAMEFISENIGKGVDWIANATGMNPNDVQAIVNAGMVAGPKVLPKAAKVAAETAQDIKSKLPTVTIVREPTKVNKLTSAQMQADFEARGGKLKQNADQLNQNYEQQRASTTEAQSVQQPVLDSNGQTIGTADLGTSKPTPTNAKFKPIEYAENGLPLDEQFARAKAMQRVLGEDHSADLAALEGKGKERATNYQTSKSDTPLGNYLAERFKDEQKRLLKYGENLIKQTGGTIGLDQSATYKRGNVLLEPLEEYGNIFDKQIGELYKERDKTAKEVPVEANFTKDLLNDESIIQLGDNEKLAKATKAKMVKLGMMDKEGNLLSTDAFTSEQLRKWLNEPNVWSPQNAGLHRLLKDSIDNDVFAHADEVIHKDARALHGLKKDTLDNPKGIATILDESGPNGINRKVDVEKIPSKIAGMGVDQFTHIINTYKNMPPELQPKAQKALAEIKSQFLNQALEQKNVSKLTDYLEDNREVMNRLFTPEEMNNLRDYHNVAHILKTDTGYPGAAVQKINVEQKLGNKIGQQILQKGAAAAAEVATGGAGFGLPALATNEIIGAKLEKGKQKKIQKAEEAAFKNAQSRFVPIKELINK